MSLVECYCYVPNYSLQSFTPNVSFRSYSHMFVVTYVYRFYIFFNKRKKKCFRRTIKQ